MATQTTNLGLTKPGYDEAADVVPAVNNNMDTLDSKIGAVPANTSVQAQITSNSQAIGNLANLTTTEKGSLVGAANELRSDIARMGKLLRDESISIDSTNITVTDLDKYTVFVAVLVSNWASGTALGLRDSGGIIRFVGISASSNGLSMSRMILNTTGNVITSISGQLGDAATGLAKIRGIS